MKEMQQKGKGRKIYKIDTSSPSNQVIQMKMLKTPPEVENTKCYQLSLDKPQVKLRPLKQQSKTNPFQT
jgi:hypothetical protein